MISTYDRYVYNTYLKSLRSSSGQPYRLRKNFETLNEVTINYIQKLSNFFKRNKEINPEDFFNASFNINNDEKFFDLKYFTSLKAIKAYTIFQKNREYQDPDSKDQLDFTKQSFKFIYNFCSNSQLPLEIYPNHITNNMFSFLLHLKERKINIYSLFAFKLFEKNFKNSDREVLCFMLGNEFIDNFDTFKVKYLNSKLCRKFAENGLEKLKNKS